MDAPMRGALPLRLTGLALNSINMIPSAMEDPACVT